VAYVFGYGSLVNCDTHTFRAVSTARLDGWRRQWCHWIDRPERRAVSLTIVPVKGAYVDGLIAMPAPEQWPDLDAREAGYFQVPVNPSFSSDPPVPASVVTYQSETHKAGSASHPIYQSYLDTVLLGFAARFGDTGIETFIDTTDGWETPILRDRAAPRYPRALALSAAQIERIDTALAKRNVTYLEE